MTDPAAVAAAFPRRPLQRTKSDKPWRDRLIGIAIVLALALPSLVMFANAWRIDAMRADLRARGVPAIVTQADTTCWQRRSATLLANARPSCTANISYTTQDGASGGLNRFPIGRRDVDLGQVLYDPQNPNRAMPAEEAHRTIEFDDIDAPIVLLCLPVLGIGIFLLGLSMGLARAAHAPKPEMVPLTQLVRNASSGGFEVRVTRGGKQYDALFAQTGGPLLVKDASNQPFVLALIGDNGRPFVLDHQLNELDLTDDERRAVWRAAGATG